MVRVLQVYPQLNNAGTERVIMNLYENINAEQVRFDFLVQQPGELDDALKQSGSKVFYIEFGKNYKNKLIEFFRIHNEYSIVHTHTHKQMGIVLEAAKIAGVKNRIAHSHNARVDLPRIFKLYKMFAERKTEKYANRFFACSNEAARWLFPTKYRECTVVNNAIDLDGFRFNPIAGKSIRQSLNIPFESKVICHVGRFAEQKNHVRIMSILNKMMQSDGTLHAILVGTGPLYNEITATAKYDRIHFLGGRNDVPDIMSASDLFLFPSLYEGLGIVAVEAQASGIKVIASTGVPKAADIGTGLFERLSLKLDDEVWIDSINNGLKRYDESKRAELSQAAYESGYNIKKVANKMREFYLGLEKNDV